MANQPNDARGLPPVAQNQEAAPVNPPAKNVLGMEGMELDEAKLAEWSSKDLAQVLIQSAQAFSALKEENKALSDGKKVIEESFKNKWEDTVNSLHTLLQNTAGAKKPTEEEGKNFKDVLKGVYQNVPIEAKQSVGQYFEAIATNGAQQNEKIQSLTAELNQFRAQRGQTPQPPPLTMKDQVLRHFEYTKQHSDTYNPMRRGGNPRFYSPYEREQPAIPPVSQRKQVLDNVDDMPAPKEGSLLYNVSQKDPEGLLNLMKQNGGNSAALERLTKGILAQMGRPE